MDAIITKEGREKLVQINGLTKKLGLPEMTEPAFVLLDLTVGAEHLVESLLSHVAENEMDDINEVEPVVEGISMLCTVEDTVTGYIGVVSAITEYSHCEALVLVETDKEERWITISRLKVI